MTILFLALAVAFEVGWALSMKKSEGFTRVNWAAATVAMYLLSVVFLALASKKMEIGVAYALWAGSGVALIAVGGVWLFGESMNLAKAASIALIVAGIVGLQLAGGGH
ncbi:MAG: multidrug efflux SMR transporter [Phycisphaerales bacterium]|nr:multidrug efflux SMR transporter [Phycisphaerales bacterium]